ncbi:hypothetical protein METBIDRAFT_43049 [Metschnikowia bicuspidata var. bicuspidata NRRL YB-4993]|uniref:tRNA-splicing endonuclease subunit Sen54 N-terminal domain-containing protein n=1 Tax=Metschnikowia bicuspidata var. bicuspidata NRRL YB-4993 TaxID=869754 RepID=A0A1A0H9I5_9ASCO|nr:hypothetical protein METBIDRAFT_43049 [Metschnikowia bicuspidata var. bicuspidata NRRL YB-4993]OBA20538.1 hypothetical protein METBIDRAFT_43049 [Metschnikowia bicuspidata var. bicuspidata NRRL YB-4993]
MSGGDGEFDLINDDCIEESINDWGLINQNQSSSKINDETLPKRSEKFFDQDGSDAQKLKLEYARDQMYLALLHIRGHHIKQLLVGVWIHSKRKAFIPHAKGSFFKDMGAPHVYKLKKKLQGVWLSEIEAIYLTERGSLVMYAANDQFLEFMENDNLLFNYETLTHLTLAHLQTTAFGLNCELVDKYKVFALLKRLGYSVMEHRALHILLDQCDLPSEPEGKKHLSFFSAIQSFGVSFGTTLRRLYTLLLEKQSHFLTYTLVYKSLALVPTSDFMSFGPPYALDPRYRIIFNVWKPSPHFSKKNPPAPDFQIGILNTSKVAFPDLGSIQGTWAYLDNKRDTECIRKPKETKISKTTDVSNKTKKEMKAQNKAERESRLDPKLRNRNNYLRNRDKLLKQGTTGRSTVFAVVDNGVVNFTTFNETDFRLRYCAKDLNEFETREDHGIVWNERLDV